MRKYLSFFRIGFQVTAAYPAPVAFRVLRHIIVVCLAMVLWQSIISPGHNPYGFSLSRMFTYYVLVEMVDTFYTSASARILSRDIVRGDLNNFLTRPFSYWSYLFSYTAGQQVASSSLSVLTAFLFFILFPGFVSLPHSFFVVVLFFLSCLLGYFLQHQLFFALGTLGFWVSESTHIRQGFNQFIGFAGGKWLPLILLPAGFAGILENLPFRYLFDFPVRIFQESIPADRIFSSFLNELLWIGVLAVIGFWLWRRGVGVYEAYGQ